ncbi:uncharacterized protein LOC108910058 [Anoplophora glabripennis]|uniref:uncharacterized protein LOC108910058 n=1 Tax=Anoplophora glabripennis TaxID=217634 RepID=UPI000873B01E|nr:uncharacterized protein LOC108910058 [Anoplophora glabripennis]
MFVHKIVALLLLMLNSGVYCLNAELETQLEASATQRKSIVPGLSITQEQIDRLADIVIRIHGVELDSQSEENYRNIENLKLVVASVSSNLEEKLEEKRRKELNAQT